MSIFAIFKPKEVPSVALPVLGVVSWSEENKAYVGALDGLKFSLSCGRSPKLPAGLIAYAEHMLQDPTRLVSGLELEKRRWIARSPEAAAEIEPLRLADIGFYWRKDGGRIFAALDPEFDNRAWRIEYQGEVCKGLGFDS